ncbi:unnamed protein product [Diamesa serratosioi]
MRVNRKSKLKKIQVLIGLLLVIFTVGILVQVIYKDNVKQSDVNEKIDWNDYELMYLDSLRYGFGEQGKKAELEIPEDIKKNNESFAIYGMSAYISDLISVNRSIPDFRAKECLKIKYLKNLPAVSIIIIFNNEAFSVFKRTLHSLYNRTPHTLIKEVILVNDFSTYDFLYDPLKNYVEENFKNIEFKIINLVERGGLMKAKAFGAQAATSDYLFIMEPHCELTYNWLPPLIEPLLRNPKLVTVPIVDNIEYVKLFYYENDRGSEGSRGVFDWDLGYQKLARYPIDAERQYDPFDTPIMTGGIFAIRKDYFFELGPYDEGLLIWGAENLEMSFKIWLCGGSLQEVPCSRIGHVFRAFTLSRKHENVTDFVAYNNKRVAEVWMDDYKEFVYQRNPNRYKIDVGDLTDAKKFKESLNCKPFQYFIDVVAPDLVKKFLPDTISFASGAIRMLNTQFCIDAYNYEKLILYPCADDIKKPPVNQYFELTNNKEIRVGDLYSCLDNYEIRPSFCHLGGGNQLIRYYLDTKHIIFPVMKDSCVTGNIEELTIKMENCDDSAMNQKWEFGTMNLTALQNWEKSGRYLEEGSFMWPD